MALKGQPFRKLAGILKGIAPTAVAALAGPYAPLAAGVMRQVLGTEKGDAESLEAAVLAAAGDPTQVVKLKEIEERMQAQETSLGIRFEEIAADDRANARSREIALKDSTTKILAYIVISAFVAMGGAVLFGYAVAESTIAGTIIGYMSAKAEQVIAYYFGSSAGSKAKTELMAAGK